MTLEKIIFLIVLFFLGFINFEGIIESLFYGPEKTYTVGILYDSKKRQSKNNISLYQSFSIQFLRRSENHFQFLQILYSNQYQKNVQQLFINLLPISQIIILPWKLNYSNVQSLIVRVDYSLTDSKYKTKVKLFQFDETEQEGFKPYYSFDTQGKPVQILKNNDSLHIQIISKDSLELVSVLPNLIFTENSIIARHKFSPPIEILCWDQTVNYLAYVQNEDPTVVHILDKAKKDGKIDLVKIVQSVLTQELAFYPLKISIIDHSNQTKLIITLLTLKNTSISLQYTQLNKLTNKWEQYKKGTLTNDIGVNPKYFQKLKHSLFPVHYHQPEQDIYLIFIRKMYFINLRTAMDKHYQIQLPSSQINKIVSFDNESKLIVTYNSPSNPQHSILLVILLNQDYSQKLRQQIGVFQYCYDITFQKREDETFLFVGTQLQYLDVYNLMQHDNPSILKASAKKLLATYALYKFSGLRFFENYFNIF